MGLNLILFFYWIICFFMVLGCIAKPGIIAADPVGQYGPSSVPDRIVLSWTGDPASSQAVSWRTDTTVSMGQAQLALASAAPGRGAALGFSDSTQTYRAVSEQLISKQEIAYYHSVEFDDLKASTVYAYRVGTETKGWSEWLHFRTASKKAEPFSFIYLGDAQNDIKQYWSRLIRGAFAQAAHTRFIVHAGDLINQANADNEWGEGYYANGWITAMRPVIAATGNHEYGANILGQRQLSEHWKPQFAFPTHGPAGLEESVYFIDYQGVRLVVLNSNEGIADQADWLAQVLRDNTQKWTIAIFHHPIFSSAAGRDNKKLRQLWMPLFDRYKVDLVLQGHDHTYGRTGNVYAGVQVQNKAQGTVYVVSVSGPKMYTHSQHPLMQRVGEHIQ